MYCIVDVETTGGINGPTRLTEIAIFRHDGQQVVDSFHSLLNPGCPIPPFIQYLTGISDEMVQDAPTFADVAESVLRITEDAIFVAHNVSFDFNFVKKELNWLGYDFCRRTLCTVRTSRKVIPGYPSYSLGKLCKSLGIPLHGRHRAQGDAAATVLLFEMLLQHDSRGLIPRVVPRIEFPN
ncbi:3'-5' exonuclease [Spirosoma aerolatum]|uniref:3'-5' exonuclease n=1 Tax=Spirosoma aerolatum TaxID=1211326 RepID=UPI0009AEEF9B|nr:exonuclease domain-containing protein [Spirosoma aerolatum]